MAAPGTPSTLNLLEAAGAPDILTAAQRYRALGLTVLPVLKGEKKSGLPGWQHLRPSADELRRLYATGKYGGVALRPGTISQNLVIIDCDGEQVYEAFCALFPARVDTYTERSGSGKGYHLFYQVDTLPTNCGTKIARKGIFDTDDLGFEMFFDTGAVIVAPSIHPSGGRYTVEKPRDVLRCADLDDVVTWALALDDKASRQRKARKPRTAQYDRPAGSDGDLPAELLRAIEQALGVNGYKRDGWSNPIRCILAHHEHDDTNPAAAWNGEKHIYSCLKCGVTDMLAVDTARALNLDVGSYYDDLRPLRKAHQAPMLPTTFISRKLSDASTQPTADHTITAKRVQFVGDELRAEEIAAAPTMLICGPTGIGKSFVIGRHINTALPADEFVTAIAQFRLLTSALHALIDHSDHYEQSDGHNQHALGQVKRLVTSLSSMARFRRRGGVVVCDEIEGVLHFLADSTTWRNSEAIYTLREFEELIRSARQFIGMDANLSEIAVRFIEGLRGPVTIKQYQSAKPRGTVTLLRNAEASIYTLGKLLSHKRGTVYAGCSSERRASEITDHFSEQGYKVLKVTRDTSNTAPVKKATTSAEARSTYDLIIYDSSWGAGVNIDEPVYAQVCIFARDPLAPEDALQLWGRIRNAKRRYAAVPADSEGYPTPTADELLADRLRRERWTAKQLGRTPEDAGAYLELAQLWAQFEARRLREMAQWRRYFIHRLQANGYAVKINEARAPEAFSEAWKLWTSERKEQHWSYVLSAEGLAVPDENLDLMRMRGVEVTGELRLRNTRYAIERALAVSTVTEQDRDLMNPNNQKRLFRLSDLMLDEINVLDADRTQAEEGRPIHKRRYDTYTRRVIAKLLKIAGHTGTPEQQLMSMVDYFRQERGAPEVTERYAALINAPALQLFKTWGHRGNNSQTVTGLCRWLLDRFGLKMKSRQLRTGDGERAMFYQMDADTLAYRLARARRATQERQASKNVHTQEKITFLDTRKPFVSLPIPPPVPIPEPGAVGWAAAPAPFNERIAALTAPIGAF